MLTLQPGSTLQGGKYIIEKVLGQGGFGITYLAQHDLLGTQVAIKEFFMKDFCNREETTSHVSVGTEGGREQVARFREKFLKEARNIAKLHHPNVVRISDVFEENGTAYYVMDYCEGGSLSDLLKLHPAGIGEPLALKYIRQVASALAHIHERKMNHLDVKPSNILLDAQDNAVLIDFGLSKQYDATGSQTSTTPVGISHGYAPIEQYKQGGISEFSPATDIYALGATLFKLLTGQTPPDAQMLLEDNLPAFSATEGVTNAIRQAMQVRRADRPQSVAAWLEMFDCQVSSLSIGSVAESTSEVLPSGEGDEATLVVCVSSAAEEIEKQRQQALREKAEREAKEAREAEARKEAERQAKAEEEARRHAEYMERKKREEDERRRDEEVERKRQAEEKAAKEQNVERQTGCVIASIIVLIFVLIYACSGSSSNSSSSSYSSSNYQSSQPGQKSNGYSNPSSNKSAEVVNRTLILCGYIGQYPIHMKLNINGSYVTGTYYYDRFSDKKDTNYMSLRGSLVNGRLELDEYNTSGNKQGTFAGTLSNCNFVGNFNYNNKVLCLDLSPASTY